MKQVQRERKKRARKKAKRAAELAESQQEKATKGKLVEEEAPPPKKKTKQEKLQSGATTPRSVSPKPGKSAKKESESKHSSQYQIKTFLVRDIYTHVSFKRQTKTSNDTTAERHQYNLIPQHHHR